MSTHSEQPTVPEPIAPIVVESSGPSLVAVILTRNEAEHITACVESVREWTDAVVVWDSCSTDATAQLAYLAGALVIERPFDNYAAQRQAALDSLRADWVLFVDADERVTPQLADEIVQTVRGAPAAAGQASTAPEGGAPESGGAPASDAEEAEGGYWVPRRNIIVGHEMVAGGFFPDYQLRLLRRERARYLAEREVHEVVDVGGREGRLREPLLHYNYRSWDQFHAKQRSYAAYEARILKSRGIRAQPHNFVLQPLREFWRRYVTLKGYRDGVAGLRLALLLAWYYGFVPYWLLAQGKV
jgi:glycosyltransferase involved in cell wall biosynthesis